MSRQDKQSVNIIIHNGLGEITLSGDRDNPYEWEELEDDLHYYNIFMKNIEVKLRQNGENLEHIYSIMYNKLSNISIRLESSDGSRILLNNTSIQNIINEITSGNPSIDIIGEEIKMTKQEVTMNMQGINIKIVNKYCNKNESILEFIM